MIAKSQKIRYNYCVKYDIELNGHFEVDINYWSGKIKLSYEGMELVEDGKNTFLLGSEKCSVGGSLFAGVYLIRGSRQALIAKLFWYDYIACILPFVAGLPGKLIGAILGIACFFVCYKIMPYVKNYFLRLIICIEIAGLLLVLIVTLAMLFPNLFGLKS